MAFTLAVGEFVGQPWRATDEFDVFMDPVARTISMASLFGFARHSPHLQLILITPQDVSAVEQAKVRLLIKSAPRLYMRAGRACCCRHLRLQPKAGSSEWHLCNRETCPA